MYTTKSGDQWDMIAKNVYGSEIYADWLMQNNVQLLDIFQFDSGTVLNTPELPDNTTSDLPPWRSR
jgi:hypothetical protein